jgi:hypothetical protein
MQALHLREAVAAKCIAPDTPQQDSHGAAGRLVVEARADVHGNKFKWPVVYEVNRKTIGTNPDLILPGQQLVIPPLPNVKTKQ